MTPLEIILTAIIWIIVGCWISYKKNWYMDDYYNREENIFTNIVLAPFVLFIVILKKYFINSKWQ